MKKQIIFLSALFISLTVFGQKDEIKNAEKALKSNDFATALAQVNQAEGLLANMDDKTKAKFYYLKGKALYKNGENIDVEAVGKAFNDLIEFENEIKSQKYSTEIAELTNGLINSIVEKASDDYRLASETKEPKDYLVAAKGFEQVYQLSPRDTAFLDNAALIYYYGQDHDKSIALFEKLLDLNYTGISTVYVANSKEDGSEITFSDQKSMDMQVKLGLAENPRVEQKESRREIIIRNLALNYGAKENYEKALEIIAMGRQEFPESYTLLIDEANLYYKSGNNVKFKEKLEEAISMNPSDPMLHYNVGVMNMEQKNIEEAIKCFEKAIELKPDYSDAYNNIGAAIIEKANPIIDEMNKSLSDFAKYDKLQAQQMEIYKAAVPYYEKAYEFNKSSISVVQTLIGLYENLEMTDTEMYATLKEAYEKMKE